MTGTAHSALSDRLICAKIRKDLAERLGLPEESITVESVGGRVGLASPLPVTEGQLQEAVGIASATHGVTSVSTDGLEVGGPPRQRSAE